MNHNHVDQQAVELLLKSGVVLISGTITSSISSMIGRFKLTPISCSGFRIIGFINGSNLDLALCSNSALSTAAISSEKLGGSSTV